VGALALVSYFLITHVSRLKKPEENWDDTGNRQYMAAEIYFSSGHN